MTLEHPIDEEIRARLRAIEGLNQTDFARRTGTNRSWLHKYINGKGHASIDDAIKIVATLLGATAQPLSERDQRLLKVWRGLSEDQQEDAIAMLRSVTKGRRAPRPESAAPSAQTPPATASRARGTR